MVVKIFVEIIFQELQFSGYLCIRVVGTTKMLFLLRNPKNVDLFIEYVIGRYNYFRHPDKMMIAAAMIRRISNDGN